MLNGEAERLSTLADLPCGVWPKRLAHLSGRTSCPAISTFVNLRRRKNASRVVVSGQFRPILAGLARPALSLSGSGYRVARRLRVAHGW